MNWQNNCQKLSHLSPRNQFYLFLLLNSLFLCFDIFIFFFLNIFRNHFVFSYCSIQQLIQNIFCLRLVFTFFSSFFCRKLTESCLSSSAGPERLSLITKSHCEHTLCHQRPKKLYFFALQLFFVSLRLPPDMWEKNPVEQEVFTLHGSAESLLQRAHSVAFDVKLKFFDCSVGEGIKH